MIKTKMKLYWLIGFVIVCILAFILVLTNLIKVNSRCIEDPFVFAARTIIDSDGDQIDAMCSCELPQGKFYFDRDGLYRDNPTIKINSPSIP